VLPSFCSACANFYSQNIAKYLPLFIFVTGYFHATSSGPHEGCKLSSWPRLRPMYESLRGLRSNVRIITNRSIGPDFKCLFSLRPILQHSVMGRSSVPHQGQRLPWHFGWLFFDRFWAPDNECLHSRRKSRLYADGEIRVFLFRPLPLSWTIHMVSNRFFVSELLLYFWADLHDDQVFYVESHLTLPNIPSIWHSLSSAVACSCVTAPFENGVWAPISVRWIRAFGGQVLIREISADWYKNQKCSSILADRKPWCESGITVSLQVSSCIEQKIDGY